MTSILPGTLPQLGPDKHHGQVLLLQIFISIAVIIFINKAQQNCLSKCISPGILKRSPLFNCYLRLIAQCSLFFKFSVQKYKNEIFSRLQIAGELVMAGQDKYINYTSNLSL